MDEPRGLWLYGVVAADQAPPPLTGVDGGAVELVREGELAALASPVPLSRFGADALQRELEELDRVAALARAHEGVLEAMLERGTVLPFRLCTIYADAEAVRAMLRREGADLGAALERLRGAVEWGVKAFATSRSSAEEAPGRVASGTDYLARKRAARADAESARQALEAAVGAIHERLSAEAIDAVLSRPQDRRLSGREEEMLLNAAYLVANARADAFHALARTLAGEQAGALALELTGPWPAYHFVAAAA